MLRTTLLFSLPYITKYVYVESTTVYVPSSELGLFPPEPGGGTHSPAGEGLGESQFRRLEKRLALCLLYLI
jgi:hypothetical protein